MSHKTLLRGLAQWGSLDFHKKSLTNLTEAMLRTRKLCAIVIDTIGRELTVNRPTTDEEDGWPKFEKGITVKANDKVQWSVYAGAIYLAMPLLRHVLCDVQSGCTWYWRSAPADGWMAGAGDLDHKGGCNIERQHAASELPQVHVHGAKGRHHFPGSLPGHRLRGVLLLPHGAQKFPCIASLNSKFSFQSVRVFSCKQEKLHMHMLCQPVCPLVRNNAECSQAIVPDGLLQLKHCKMHDRLRRSGRRM